MRRIQTILALLCALTIVGGGIYIGQKVLNTDTTAPVLTVEQDVIEAKTGASDGELIQGVTAYDDKDGDITDQIMVENIRIKSGDRTDSNEFQIDYVVFDSSDNMSSISRTLVYTDYVSPRFDLTQNLRFPQSQSINLLNYIKVSDCIDGDISTQVILNSNQGMSGNSDVGIYTCSLSVTNSVGDTSSIEVPVEIYEDNYDSESVRPSLTLSRYVVYLEKNSEFKAEQYLSSIVIDNGDQVLGQDEIDELGIFKVYTNLDTSEPGTYTVEYTYKLNGTFYKGAARMVVVVIE